MSTSRFDTERLIKVWGDSDGVRRDILVIELGVTVYLLNKYSLFVV